VTGEYSGRFALNITSSPTSIKDIENLPDDHFSVYYSQGILRVTVKLDEGSDGILSISNLTGQTLLLKEIYESGYYEFNPRLRTGVYIVTFTYGNRRISRKIFIYS